MELAREKVGLWIEMLRKFSRSPDSLGAFRHAAQNALDNYGLRGIGGSGRYKNYRRATFRVIKSHAPQT